MTTYIDMGNSRNNHYAEKVETGEQGMRGNKRLKLEVIKSTTKQRMRGNNRLKLEAIKLRTRTRL